MMTQIKKSIFKLLLALNNKVLPSYYQKDPSRLSKTQKAILGYRYWVLTHALS